MFLGILISTANAGNFTINELIESLNYSYSNGSISVSNKTDYMLDRNSNGLNDTLVINLTNTIAGEGIFNFIITLFDKNNILINTTNKQITSNDLSVQINFPTSILSSKKFNYTIEINNVNDELLYREYKVQTNSYTNLETGTNITRITDEKLNKHLRINLTVNSTQSISANVTVNLGYITSIISRTEEKTLSLGTQNITINFDDETIKSTHYNGNFTIQSIIIGSKPFIINRNTPTYYYEDFANLTYAKKITDSKIDTNGNNLSEFLEINFSIVSKAAETINLTYDLYDEFDNYVITVNKTAILTAGNHTIQTLINGSEIYKTKISGPYLVTFAKIAVGNETRDAVFDFHITNETFYTDYERPPLPDLNITMKSIFDDDTNSTNITINISNDGQAAAFNVFLDIFDNLSYQNNRSTSFLAPNEYLVYQFNITQSSNSSLITAIVDFDNLVDESDETNNIVQNIDSNEVSLNITLLNMTYANGTYKIFRFVIFNDGESTVTNIRWQFDAGDGSVINSTQNSTLSVNEKMIVSLGYNYSSSDSYSVLANATGLSQYEEVFSSFSLPLIRYLEVENLSVINSTGSWRMFRFKEKNYMSTNLTNVSWTFNTKNSSIINSTIPIILTPNKTIIVFLPHNFTGSGTFNVNATARNNSLTDSQTLVITV